VDEREDNKKMSERGGDADFNDTISVSYFSEISAKKKKKAFWHRCSVI